MSVAAASPANLDSAIRRIRTSLVKRPGRPISDPGSEKLQRAAVIVILRPDSASEELVTLLVKRRTKEGDPWSGHIAFPGGRSIPADRDIQATAARELLEETSLVFGQFELLGTLDELTSSSGLKIRVTPFVTTTAEEVPVKIDEEEIETFVWIPLSFFMRTENTLPYSFERSGGGPQVSTPSYQFLGKYVVWGMTLRIIQDLLAKTKG